MPVVPSTSLVLQLKCTAGAAEYVASAGIAILGVNSNGLAVSETKWGLIGTDTTGRQGKLESTATDDWQTYSIPIGDLANSEGFVASGAQFHVTADDTTVQNLPPPTKGSFDLQKSDAIIGHVTIAPMTTYTVQLWSFMATSNPTSTSTLFYYQGIHAHYVPNDEGTRDLVLQKMPSLTDFKKAAAAGNNVGEIYDWVVVVPADKLTSTNDLGSWVHWTFVIDGETGLNEIYRFGVLVAEGYTTEVSTGMISKSIPIEPFMAFGNAFFERNHVEAVEATVTFAPFDGQLTDIRVWDRGLGCKESAVTQYWNTLEGNEFGLQAWFQFDVTDNSTFVYDSAMSGAAFELYDPRGAVDADGTVNAGKGNVVKMVAGE
jgi:hypothetical protein